MDMCSLHGKKDARRTCGQRGHWVAECPKRCGKAGHGGKDDNGNSSCKEGNALKGKGCARFKGKSKGKGDRPQAFEGYCNHSWKWGHMEKVCFKLAKSRSQGGKGNRFKRAEPENPRRGCGWRIWFVFSWKPKVPEKRIVQVFPLQASCH